MKAAFWSVIGAVISGILLLVAQNYLQNKPLTEISQVNYDISENVVDFDRAELQSLVGKLSEITGHLRIATVIIQNGGNVPLVDQEVSVRVGIIGDGDQNNSGSDQILKVATTSFPGKDIDAATIKVDEGAVRIRYKVLNPGEQHRLWIGYDAIGSISVSSRKPGLIVKNGLNDSENNGTSIFDYTWIAVAFLLALLAGFISAYFSIWTDLKNRGQDLDALLKLPKV